MLALFLDLLAASEKTAAEEGRDIVLSMLVVGLIFVGVAILGDIYQRGARKRHKQRARH
jgi:heme/copper-type cytochrome/quinol oxidase subunit 2